MSASRFWVFPVGLVLMALFSAPEADAGKKKAKNKEAILKIANLTTATPFKEVKKLEQATKKVKGVVRVTVSRRKGEVTVRYKKAASLNGIKAAVAKVGFTIVDPKQDDGVTDDDATDAAPTE